MKNKKLWIGISVMILVFGLMLVGCPDPDPVPETYSFWIINFSYNASVTDIASLTTKGMFKHVVLSDDKFEVEKEDYTKDKVANVWTKDDLKKYLIGLDLSDTEAETEATWFVSVKHGYFFIRGDGTTVHSILK